VSFYISIINTHIHKLEQFLCSAAKQQFPRQDKLSHTLTKYLASQLKIKNSHCGTGCIRKACVVQGVSEQQVWYKAYRSSLCGTGCNRTAFVGQGGIREASVVRYRCIRKACVIQGVTDATEKPVGYRAYQKILCGTGCNRTTSVVQGASEKPVWYRCTRKVCVVQGVTEPQGRYPKVI
jgi:hypothetical protein